MLRRADDAHGRPLTITLPRSTCPPEPLVTADRLTYSPLRCHVAGALSGGGGEVAWIEEPTPGTRTGDLFITRDGLGRGGAGTLSDGAGPAGRRGSQTDTSGHSVVTQRSPSRLPGRAAPAGGGSVPGSAGRWGDAGGVLRRLRSDGERGARLRERPVAPGIAAQAIEETAVPHSAIVPILTT